MPLGVCNLFPRLCCETLHRPPSVQNLPHAAAAVLAHAQASLTSQRPTWVLQGANVPSFLNLKRARAQD